MRIRILGAALIMAALPISSCSENGPTSPVAGPALGLSALIALPDVRISEIHYDNTGTDVGEAIEISGPAGTDLNGWQLVLYNGNGGASYDTKPLSGFIPTTCGARGVVVVDYPSNGIQNGSPDGMALVRPGGAVGEFLSYEGTFAAVGGPADGLTSTDIIASETGSEAIGQSLQRNNLDVWSKKSSTFGRRNDEPTTVGPITAVGVGPATASIFEGATQQFTAGACDSQGNPFPSATATWSSGSPLVATVDATGLATGLKAGDASIVATTSGMVGTATLHVNAPPPLAKVVINELMADPQHAAGGASFGEWFEVYNYGSTDVDLQGWTIASAGQPSHVIGSLTTPPTHVIVPAGGYAVLGRGEDITRNGGIRIDYSYFTGTSSTTIFLDATDYLVLRDEAGARVDSVRWTNSGTMVKGFTRALKDAAVENANVDGANWGYSTVAFGDGDIGTPGAANGILRDTPPTTTNALSFTGRLATDPALPVGFEDQLFATLRDGGGNVVATDITWESLTPSVASIDAAGVMRALAVGTATVRATAKIDGTSATFSLPTREGVASTTAQYQGNAEFGEPTDADGSDDFIVRRAQYTASYNKNRGTPNWVSYDLEATHFGPEDRCDCFTFDPLLPASFPHYTTADYTGAGAIAGYGIDRGHFARSFDRTSASLDNATTFYFTNIVPQAADLNQGPWALMENALGDLARFQNKEVYIIAGVAGKTGTVKGEGKIAIPASTWKVAVIMPRDKGLADVHDYHDVEVIAVNMPNVPGIRNVPWETYKTTVDAVEALSGYDVLALLPDNIERIVERGGKPLADLDGPYTSTEGAPVAMSAAASLDPDGSIAEYEWSFGDGATASGAAVTHMYAQDGAYSVRLIVTDDDALADTVATTVSVSNVAPSIGAFDGATLLPGETYRATGSFTDPGADAWRGTVDYGDGTGESAFALDGKSFTLSHRYNRAGVFTVTVRIADDDVTSMRTQSVTVLTRVAAVESAIALVDGLAARGKVSAGNANSLMAKLEAAQKQLARGNTTPASGQLGSLIHELDAMVRSGRLAAADAEPLRVLVARVIESISV
jgi:DNA/RNA endonuclease G (NUC1)